MIDMKKLILNGIMCVLPLPLVLPTLIILASVEPEEIATNPIFEGIWLEMAIAFLTMTSVVYFITAYIPKIRP